MPSVCTWWDDTMNEISSNWSLPPYYILPTEAQGIFSNERHHIAPPLQKLAISLEYQPKSFPPPARWHQPSFTGSSSLLACSALPIPGSSLIPEYARKAPASGPLHVLFTASSHIWLTSWSLLKSHLLSEVFLTPYSKAHFKSGAVFLSTLWDFFPVVFFFLAFISSWCLTPLFFFSVCKAPSRKVELPSPLATSVPLMWSIQETFTEWASEGLTLMGFVKFSGHWTYSSHQFKL